MEDGLNAQQANNIFRSFPINIASEDELNLKESKGKGYLDIMQIYIYKLQQSII